MLLALTFRHILAPCCVMVTEIEGEFMDRYPFLFFCVSFGPLYMWIRGRWTLGVDTVTDSNED